MKTTKIKYYEDKEKRTIVAVATIYEINGVRLLNEKTLRAKAKCCQEDTYSTEKGKFLAKKRLKVKMLEFEQKFYMKMEQHIEKMFESSQDKRAKVLKEILDFSKTL